jgi:hypothetical protein
MFGIEVDTLALSRSSRGSVTGPLFLRVQDACFPEESWSDFPVVVLGWWIAAVTRLISGASEVEEFDFMDGPHLLVVRRRSEGALHLACCTEQGTRRVVYEAVLPAAALQKEVLDAARLVADSCEQRGWLGPDLTALQNARR